MARQVGWAWWEAAQLGNLAESALEGGRTEEGERRAREYLALAREIGDRTNTVYGLAQLAWVATDRGDAERAAVLWAAVEAEERGRPWTSGRRTGRSTRRASPLRRGRARPSRSTTRWSTHSRNEADRLGPVRGPARVDRCSSASHVLDRVHVALALVGRTLGDVRQPSDPIDCLGSEAADGEIVACSARGGFAVMRSELAAVPCVTAATRDH